jgi:hypothetical protein
LVSTFQQQMRENPEEFNVDKLSLPSFILDSPFLESKFKSRLRREHEEYLAMLHATR